jgi:hypothetical protein
MLIGVAAQAQHGKDTLADYLAKRLNEQGGNWIRDAFALNVKRIYCNAFGVDMDFVEKWKVISEPPPGFETTVRKSLQFIGDGFRKIKGSVWTDLMFRDLLEDKILSDIRYPNEFVRIKHEAVRNRTKGMNILIGRTDKLNDDPNGSEAQIKPYVQWGLDNFEAPFTDLHRIAANYWRDSPPASGEFDVFIRNDGSKEDLYQTIDEQLVPYVQKYFKEKLCLT